MIGSVLIDERTEFGARVAGHLRDEIVVWLGMTPEAFAQRYSVPLQIRLTRLSGH
jgi:hypothetical protein